MSLLQIQYYHPIDTIFTALRGQPLRNLLYISIASLLLSILSCGDESYDADGINAKPIDLFLESEELKARPYLKIKTSAFSHEFMFYGTFIPMLNSPSGHSLKGRIVRFEIFADRVVMLESPKGHSIADEAESTILLAEFPIVQTEGDGVVVDFAKGMTSAFTARNVHSQGLADKGSGTSEQFKSVFLSASFVKAITIDKSVLTISQIAQWRNIKTELVSAEFRYSFRAYTPSPTFKKKPFGKNRWVQYFSTPPQVQAPTTESVAFIAKWSVEQPIVFYISANTPPAYRQAVKDGLLFWNHIFGRKVVEVEDLPAHLSAPHPRLNIVQWVPWDNEASAYADMVVDHLTGETLQAQIYLRSGWVFKSTKKLRAQLEELLLSEPGQESMVPIEEAAPMPSMFDYEEPSLEALTEYDALIELVENMSTTEISPQTLSILSSDIIRTVIAHEMGHVLGLRHNLGSSTSANVSLIERSKFLREYLLSGKAPLGAEKYFAESIMDVFSAADDALMGSQIREFIEAPLENSPLQKIYRYDHQAIAYGYFDQAMKADTPFCSDDDIPRYLDCQRWDMSNTPLLFAASRLNATPTQVAMILAETFVAALNPDRPGGALKPSDVPLLTAAVKKSMETNIKQLFFWFHRNARSIQIETQYPAFGAHNQKDITRHRFQKMREQLEAQGLNDSLFAIMPPFRAKNLEASALAEKFRVQLIKQLIEAKKTHPELILSDGEIAETSKIALNFFVQLNKELITLFASVVSRMQFDDPEYQLPIEESLGQIAREIVLHQDQTDATHPRTIPLFTYDFPARDAAAQLLNPALGIFPDWSFDNLRDITNDLKLLMRAHGGSDTGNGIDLNSMPREKRQWMLDQNRILNTLTRMKGMSRNIEPQ